MGRHRRRRTNDYNPRLEQLPIVRNVAVCPRPDKDSYRSKKDAKVMLTRHRRINRAGIEAYRCACGAWHLGHKPRIRPVRRTFLDVGAHEGQTLEAVVGRFDRIFAFEPMPHEYDVLNGRFGGVEGVKLLDYGLAGATGERDLYGTNAGMEASFWPDKLDVDASAVTSCMFRRASEFFEAHLRDPSETVIVKLNCEGAEVEIMNDLLDSGQATKIWNVLIDFDVRKVPSQSATEADLLDRMRDAGFDRFSLSTEVMRGDTHRARTENWLRAIGELD